ncbi:MULTISPECIES: pirin family protein [unclassified Corallococcus]|uniref:pirin family protein n=1 Tax=unclassified Corallococcus TaxID=2685029 RepID=UPI001A8CA615|nr:MULTISPECIES: pirin family protein [unclassified Corallococcus]MBN9684153.1 pirin family protein [Corallococcus sp. NCSPR001]WAS84357.1 pirin family protein [Corallococcus sp. NCRR]
MMNVRPSEARGHANHGWLDSHHTFSFASYFDPENMGFRALRVINEDRVQAGEGFDTHPHRDMEIITYPLSGAIAHRDSTGGQGLLRAGEVQRMTAGTGVMHSEMNGSNEDVHFLQIWIIPEKKGLKPEYEQKFFPEKDRQGRWRVVASPDARDGSLTVHQDVVLNSTLLSPGEKAEYTLAKGRHAWVQIARGTGTLNGVALKAGDGVAVSDESSLVLTASEPLEALLFDLA